MTIDGTPAPAGIRIDFQPQGPEGSPSTAITDVNGRYELCFTPARKGVMPGECRVMLQIPPHSGPDGPVPMPESLKALRLPAQYAGPESPLTRTVKPGHNTIDIAIDTTPPPTKAN